MFLFLKHDLKFLLSVIWNQVFFWKYETNYFGRSLGPSQDVILDNCFSVIGFALLQELLQESENQVVKSNDIVYENKVVKFDNNLSKTAINQGYILFIYISFHEMNSFMT